MIKSLRITILIAAILASGFLVFSAVAGKSSDKQADELLNAQSLIEKFKQNKGKRKQPAQGQTSPLVKQAKAFALYLNPPPPKPKAKPKSSPKAARSKPTPKPKQVSAKFELIATSFNSQRPELSLALIDEPGKGMRWVRQFGEVGHLSIDEVKDGVIVVKDGKKTFELASKRPTKVNLLKTSNGAQAAPKPVSSVVVPKPVSAAKDPVRKTRKVVNNAEPVLKIETPEPSEEETMESLKNFMEKLEADQDAEDEDKIDSEQLKMMMDDMQADRVSSEEAQMLDELGKELKEDQSESDQAKPKSRELDPNKSRKIQPSRRKPFTDIKRSRRSSRRSR